MKKGQRIGMNSALGELNEKYITFKKSIKRYTVTISTHSFPKQKRVGTFKTLEEAIMCRDKYLSK